MRDQIKGFDVDKMFVRATEAINHFAQDHQNETFYAFSIDASMLCLNSEEKFQETLKKYQDQFPTSYAQKEGIDRLKYNTGDWDYQGFFSLEEGFDHELYGDHYHIPFDKEGLSDEDLLEEFSKTPYHQAMSKLLKNLVESNVFGTLNLTQDFRAFLSEHEY